MEPDERALLEDLADVRFLEGVDRGHWRLVDRTQTLATFELTARTGRRLGIQLDCAGYPGVAPTGQLWSVADNAPLPVSEWPTGDRVGQVFNPNWSTPNGGAFYFPYDRRAIDGHEGWATQSAGHVWDVSKTLVDVLVLLRDILRFATGPPISASDEELAS